MIVKDPFCSHYVRKSVSGGSSFFLKIGPEDSNNGTKHFLKQHLNPRSATISLSICNTKTEIGNDILILRENGDSNVTQKLFLSLNV